MSSSTLLGFMYKNALVKDVRLSSISQKTRGVAAQCPIAWK